MTVVATPGDAAVVLRDGRRALKFIPPQHPQRPATLTLVHDRLAPTPALINQAMDRCRQLGISHAITQALRSHDQAAFLLAGGTVFQQLHLLVLEDPIATHRWRRTMNGVTIARHRPDHTVANIDFSAFGPFWHFDAAALRDALAATPASRLRVVLADGQPVGHVIAGASQDRGFLQRIAVHPSWQDRGLGRILMADALGWLGRRRVMTVTINTQIENDRARGLYEQLGFVLQPEPLVVVGYSTSGAP